MTRTPFLTDTITNRSCNHDNEPRKMGVEIELAGLKADALVETLVGLFEGTPDWISPYEINVKATKVGDFKVELDSQDVKNLGSKSKLTGDPAKAEAGLEKTYLDAVEAVSSQVVPWEIVSPPIEFKQLNLLYELVDQLRDQGAKGTKAALHYAFGVHLNPELSSLDSSNITRHLKSFFCLYDWMVDVERPDLARRVTPYINHFETDYIKLVLDEDYQPDIDQLIDDYLEHNPTRNRNLDMLPLFAHIDEQRVRAKVDDSRVNARPTFHYRLPNCEVAEPNWNLDQTFETWFAVEQLALSDDLQAHCNEYLLRLNRLLPASKTKWVTKMADVVGRMRDRIA